MGLFDKLKNALFEEEYVEVEEKEKKVKKEKEKKEKIKKEKPVLFNKEEKEVDVYEEQKPIAKRIVPREKVESEELLKEEKNDNLLNRNSDVKITMVEDDDLISQNTYPTLPPISEVTRKRTETVNYDSVVEEEYVEPAVAKEEVVVKEKFEERPVKLYQASKKDSYLDNYKPHEYGNYEKQKEKEKEVFKPSPIISPVYGIVEDTRFMEKPKREIRITTSISHDKINIDEIRRKAYGDLSDDIGDNIGLHQSSEPSYQEEIDEEETVENDNVLLDLTNDENAPEVNNITVGDAVEYFEDLGLEYNEDYIDADKPTRTSKLEKEEEKLVDESDEPNELDAPDFLETNSTAELPKIIDQNIDDAEDEISSDNVIVKDKDSDNTTDSDNLFDLIDSMYE